MANDAPGGDGLVFAFLLLFAAGFAAQASRMLLTEGFSVGCGAGYMAAATLFLLGARWSSLKQRLNASFAESLTRVSSDAKWWVLVLLLMFVCLSVPTLTKDVRRAMHTTAIESGQSQSQPAETPTPYRYRNEMTMHQTADMIDGLQSAARSRIQWLGATTIIVTAPAEEQRFRDDLAALMNVACTTCDAERCGNRCQIMFVPDHDPHGLDASAVKIPERPGIVVHSLELAAPNRTLAPMLKVFLESCFLVSASKQIPEGIRAMVPPPQRGNLIWMELGKGSPWNSHCRGEP